MHICDTWSFSAISRVVLWRSESIIASIRSSSTSTEIRNYLIANPIQYSSLYSSLFSKFQLISNYNNLEFNPLRSMFLRRRKEENTYLLQNQKHLVNLPFEKDRDDISFRRRGELTRGGKRVKSIGGRQMAGIPDAEVADPEVGNGPTREKRGCEPCMES